MSDTIPYTVSLVLLVWVSVFNFILYGFCKALDGCSQSEMEKRAEEEGNEHFAVLLGYLDKVNRLEYTRYFLTALHCVILGLFVFPPVYSKLINDTVIAFLQHSTPYAAVLYIVVFLAFLILMVSITMILPSRLAARHAERFAAALLWPMDILCHICSPFVALMIGISTVLMMLFGETSHKIEEDVTEEEIISMVNEGHEAGVLLESEAKMINNIFEFGDKQVQDIMTHRNQVFAFSSDITLEDAIQSMLEERYSRFPVYEETLDHIIGILYMKDALRAQASGTDTSKKLFECGSLLRKPFFVPQTKKIDQLFHIMKIKKLQLAVVVDEYGQTDGIVAMEDILEEIVGNILDEYDEEGSFIEKTGADEYILEGLTPLEELEERFGLTFKDEPFETLNGFLISRLEHIPEDKEAFHCEYEGFYFEVLAVENRVIQSVLLRKCETEDTVSASENSSEGNISLEEDK